MMNESIQVAINMLGEFCGECAYSRETDCDDEKYKKCLIAKTIDWLELVKEVY
jgi:hypothetical protein